MTSFASEHPGGEQYIKLFNGKDATTEFDGGIYNHTSGARNLLSRYRVAKVD